MKIDLELSLVSGLLFLVNVAHFRAVHWPTCISYTLGLIFALLVVAIYVSRINNTVSTWQAIASLCLLCGIFAHPGIIVVVPFCAYWTYSKTLSVKESISKTGLLFAVGTGAIALAIWVSPRANQASILTTTLNATLLVENFFWYFGRLFTSAFWLTKTTSSYTKPMSEIIFGVVISAFFFFVLRKNSHSISVWPVWITLFVLIFINSEEYRLVFGPSRHLYFASVGSSLMLAWILREIIEHVFSSRTTRQTVFFASITAISLSSIFFLKKAEAFAIYFAGRGHAYRVIEDQENLHKAAFLFARAIQHAPDLVPDDIYLRLASMGFAIGEPHFNIFEDAIKRFPHNTTIAMLQGAAFFLDSDEMRWREGEKKIQKAHHQSLNKNSFESDTALAFHNLAGYYHRQKEYDKAIRLFKKAIQYNPYHITAYTNMGIALYELGNIQESIDAYRRAIALRPEYVSHLQSLANTILNKGDAQAALPFFIELAQIDSTNSDVRYNLGILFGATGDLVKAEKALHATIQLNPSDTEALQKLAEVQYAQQNYSDAMKSYYRLLAMQPNDALTAFNLGVLMVQNNHISDAVDILQKAIEIHPNDIDLHFALAHAFEHQKKIEDAIKLYQFILAQNPNHSDAQERLKALVP